MSAFVNREWGGAVFSLLTPCPTFLVKEFMKQRYVDFREPRHIDFTLYPNVPGSQPRDTSEEAAESMRESAPTLRAKALDVLRACGPLTADEIAKKLGKTVLAIRPRITELNKMGHIEATGYRRKNASGRQAAVWRIKLEK